MLESLLWWKRLNTETKKALESDGKRRGDGEGESHIKHITPIPFSGGMPTVGGGNRGVEVGEEWEVGFC